MNTIPKLFKREFPLILFQIWARNYKYFMGEKITIFPRYIFILKDGLGDAYRNPALSEEVNTVIKKKAGKEMFFKDFYRKYLERFEELQKFWQRNDLSREELLKFLKTLSDFWPAIYASIFIPSNASFSKEQQDLFLNLRKKIERVEFDASHLINRTIKRLYPWCDDLEWSVSLEDLQENKIPKRSDLEKRVIKEIILVDDEIISRERLVELQKEHQFILEPVSDLSSRREFKGQTAYQGNISGIVRIIMKVADINKIKEGEILVSPMTIPTFAPAMKKAAAFVTDEGGITCHAAIVARELKKPCIIGTKIATQVLKDGDRVEIDASKGIVRRLK